MILHYWTVGCEPIKNPSPKVIFWNWWEKKTDKETVKLSLKWTWWLGDFWLSCKVRKVNIDLYSTLS